MFKLDGTFTAIVNDLCIYVGGEGINPFCFLLFLNIVHARVTHSSEGHSSDVCKLTALLHTKKCLLHCSIRT